MARAFLDTNIIVYANDRADPEKQHTALTLIGTLFRSGTGVISTQVLMEYAAVASRKLGQSREAIHRQTINLERLGVVPISGELIRNGLDLAALYSVFFRDGVILSAARYSECAVLWTEDLTHRQLYAGVEARNPFEQ
ncbi:MAG: PIN domain-containing protein [Spirochaetia bacterium]